MHIDMQIIYILNNMLCYLMTKRKNSSKNDLDDAKDKGHYKYPGTCRDLDADEIKTRLNQGISFTYRVRIPD